MECLGWWKKKEPNNTGKFMNEFEVPKHGGGWFYSPGCCTPAEIQQSYVDTKIGQFLKPVAIKQTCMPGNCTL